MAGSTQCFPVAHRLESWGAYILILGTITFTLAFLCASLPHDCVRVLLWVPWVCVCVGALPWGLEIQGFSLVLLGIFTPGCRVSSHLACLSLWVVHMYACLLLFVTCLVIMSVCCASMGCVYIEAFELAGRHSSRSLVCDICQIGTLVFAVTCPMAANF